MAWRDDAQPNVGPALSVALLALPDTTPTALYGLQEVFAGVGVAWQRLTGEHQACRPVHLRVVARDARPFTGALGAPVKPHAALSRAPRCDLVVVTDLDLHPDLDPRGRWPAEAAWLRRRYAGGATIASVCTGSVLLAEAGLLDGQEATTHWGARRIFERFYPGVRLRAQRILCPSGDSHRLVTSGGSAAWADLALYLIARYCGRAEARRIAKVFVLGDHSDGQLPFAAMDRHRYHEDALIASCQGWLADHYAERTCVAALLAHAGIPPRSFARRFVRATGYTPLAYIQALRIEEAKQMLEATPLPSDEIGCQVGYADPAFFRRLFKRHVGVTPARYRLRHRDREFPAGQPWRNIESQP